MNTPLVESPAPGIGQAHVQVDLGNMIGRIKAPPVCEDALLKEEAMSTEELVKLSFPSEAPKSSLCTVFHTNEPSVVSSSSSTTSRESFHSDVATPLRSEHKHSEFNHKVTAQKVSRNGRLSQRYDTTSQRVCRLVTGCVPIVEGGRILFISASRKSEWILPKGGWEKDEQMEESAIRECFEEAGVLGVLGPRLADIEYETRKAKKRRLEFEELRKKSTLILRSKSSTPEKEEEKVALSDNQAAAQLSNEDLSRIRGEGKSSDETCSVASDTSHTHSFVRMTFFPLYVSEVKDSWPESGRLRKAVEIDEAIRMCASRPELQSVLKEVKERNLHIPPADAMGANRVHVI